MTRKTKQIMARILAVVMAFTLIPWNTWAAADVVLAEEASEALTEEETDGTTVDVQETQDEADEKEAENDVIKETETFAPETDEEKVQDEKDAGTKEDEKKETENKTGETVYVHNFTNKDGNYNDTSDDCFKVGSSEKTGLSEITYNGMSLKKAMKITSSAGITFNAPKGSKVVLVYTLADEQGGIKIDGVSKTVNKDTTVGAYVLEVTLDTDESHSVLRDKKEAYLYYISVTVPAGSVKEPVKIPTATPAVSEEVKVGDKITLSCETEGATIYYTTDGKEPKNNDSKKTYSNGIPVTVDMVIDNEITIKAYAAKADCTDSETASFTYNVSTTSGENQVQTPTAEPETEEVPRGTKVILKSEDGASVYYTTDETDPNTSSTRKLFTEAEPIVIEQDTVIKAVAEKAGKDKSFVASFTYTIKKAQIKVDASSASIISSVELDGDVIFTNGTKEVFDIGLKAVKNTAPNNDVQTKAESVKENGGEIIYYDFSLVNNENTGDVSIAEDTTGTLKITMPYAIASNVNKRNGIAVVNAAGKIEPVKEADGFVFHTNSMGTYAIVINPAGAVDDIEITESGGYEEGAYAEWKAVDGADGYMAYVAKAGGKFERVDDELIREYKDYWRVDTVGLAKGTYYIRIDAVVLGTDGDKKTATVISSNRTDALKVINYDRSGFAFSKQSKFKTGSGAYNDDGTLKSDAQVIYVTAETAKTVQAKVITDQGESTATGLQAILGAREKGVDQTPLDVRIIGCVTANDMDSLSSTDEGLQIKGKDYSEMNITIEGIGEDAAIKEFGILIRGCGNVELRNFAVIHCMDDSISLNTHNCNIWVHDMDLFYGKNKGGDQQKGDGTLDLKDDTQYCTFSYNHFWDSGKSSLCGMKSETGPNYITYHHNWFDHSDSRHPRIRTMTVHIYNNYYDGNAKYGVGVTTGSCAFVDSNYFRNCKYPMMIALQGTDAAGEKTTFSGETGGMIKAYGNHIEGAKSYLPYSSTNTVEFDAYEVDDAGVQVPSTVKSKNNSTYNNFDTADTMYDYVADTPEAAKEKIEQYAGRVNGGDLRWTFNNATEDENYALIPGLEQLVLNYKPSVKAVGGNIPGNVEVLQGGGSTDIAPAPSEIEAPTASPASGIVEKGTEVALIHESGADIYYTIDGTEPTEASNKYTNKIKIEVTTTIRAIAVKDGKKSDVIAFKYTVLSEGSGGDPNPGPGGDDDDKPARGTYTLDIKTAYETTVPSAATNREEMKGTNEFFTLLFCGKTGSDGTPSGSAISEKTSGPEFEDDYQSNRYFLTSGAAKTNQASVKIITKGKTTVTVWWQPGGEKDLQQRQLTVLNASGKAAYTSNISNLDVNKGYVTPFELPDAGTYYIGSAQSSINIYKIEVKYPETSGGDDTVIDPPTATPASGNLKKGDTVTLNAAGDIYYTITTDGSEPAAPTVSDEAKYTTPIAVTADVGATVKIKAVTISDKKNSDPAVFTYTIVEDTPEPKEKLSNPEASPAPEEGMTYPVNIEIGLTSKENGTVYYTTDGTDPKKEDGTPSEKSKAFSDAEPIKLSTAGTHTIKAFAVKEGYPSSDTETFTYVVSENATMEQLAEPEIAPASKEVEKGTQITVTITKAKEDPEDTEIYYTTDGTTPKKDAKLLYKEAFTLTVNDTTTINAIAVKDGAIPSTAASATYTVKDTGSTGKKPDGIHIAGLEEQYAYTGAKIIPDIEVWDYYQGIGTFLAPGVDYTVTYKNNVKPTDAAEVIVKGKGNYKGKSESKTFKIIQANDVTANLISLKGAKIKDKIEPQPYKGEAILPDFTVTFKDGTSITYTKNTDSSIKSLYKRTDGEAMNVNVAVSNNINKGTATILVTGGEEKGKVTSVKKTFKITPADISSATVTPTAGTYAVNGAAPASLEVTILLNGKTVELKKGKDYTIKCSNNKKAGQAAVTVTGKGNYAKKCAPKEYTVNKLDMSMLKVDSVTAYEGIKAGKVKATIVDQKGNVIALKPAQYELEICKADEAADGTKTKGAKYEDGAELGKEFIYVSAKAKDETNLESNKATPETEFKVGIDISKAKFKLKKDVVKYYTGSAVTLDGSEFDNPTIKVNGTEVPLAAGTHYKIESYSNNVNKGTATAVIKGIGDYSGTKTVKFKITQKTMRVDYVTPWEFWQSVAKQLTQ